MYWVDEIHQELWCGKQDCAYCRQVFNNDGRATEKALLELGLVRKEKQIDSQQLI